MALSNLAGWTEDKAASACGVACGATDKSSSKGTAAETPAACGAADKPEEKPLLCPFGLLRGGIPERKAEKGKQKQNHRGMVRI